MKKKEINEEKVLKLNENLEMFKSYVYRVKETLYSSKAHKTERWNGTNEPMLTEETELNDTHGPKWKWINRHL